MVTEKMPEVPMEKLRRVIREEIALWMKEHRVKEADNVDTA